MGDLLLSFFGERNLFESCDFNELVRCLVVLSHRLTSHVTKHVMYITYNRPVVWVLCGRRSSK